MAKIIDQKGRIFGLINIIDLAVILLLASFLPILYFGYKVTAMENKKEGAGWVSVQIKLLEIKPESNTVILKGDAEKILKKLGVAADDKIALTVNNVLKKGTVADVEILCIKKEGVLYYKASPVKIGSTISFTVDLYDISGSIVGIEGADKNR